MIPEYESRIAVRLGKTERQQLEQLIASGKFQDLSVAVRTAIKEFLSKQGA